MKLSVKIATGIAAAALGATASPLVAQTTTGDPTVTNTVPTDVVDDDDDGEKGKWGLVGLLGLAGLLGLKRRDDDRVRADTTTNRRP